VSGFVELVELVLFFKSFVYKTLVVKSFTELFPDLKAAVLLKFFFSLHYLKPSLFDSLLFLIRLQFKHLLSLTAWRMRELMLLQVFAATSYSCPNSALFVELS